MTIERVLAVVGVVFLGLIVGVLIGMLKGKR